MGRQDERSDSHPQRSSERIGSPFFGLAHALNNRTAPLQAQDKLKLSLGRKEESEVVLMLQKVPIFSNLDSKRLRRMAKSFHQREYGAGETIVKEGESSVAFY